MYNSQLGKPMKLFKYALIEYCKFQKENKYKINCIYKNFFISCCEIYAHSYFRKSDKKFNKFTSFSFIDFDEFATFKYIYVLKEEVNEEF